MTRKATYRLIPRIIYSILFNKKIVIQGKGEAVRSFIYSKIFVMDIQSLKYSKKNKTYHFSNKKFLTILRFIKLCD